MQSTIVVVLCQLCHHAFSIDYMQMSLLIWRGRSRMSACYTSECSIQCSIHCNIPACLPFLHLAYFPSLHPESHLIRSCHLAYHLVQSHLQLTISVSAIAATLRILWRMLSSVGWLSAHIESSCPIQRAILRQEALHINAGSVQAASVK